MILQILDLDFCDSGPDSYDSTDSGSDFNGFGQDPCDSDVLVWILMILDRIRVILVILCWILMILERILMILVILGRNLMIFEQDSCDSCYLWVGF